MKSLSQNPLSILEDTVTAQDVTGTPISKQNQSKQVFSQAAQPLNRKLALENNVEIFRDSPIEENVRLLKRKPTPALQTRCFLATKVATSSHKGDKGI